MAMGTVDIDARPIVATGVLSAGLHRLNAT
jgi:hypothetical protein